MDFPDFRQFDQISADDAEERHAVLWMPKRTALQMQEIRHETALLLASLTGKDCGRKKEKNAGKEKIIY